jgi:hypothetical protein
MGDSAVKCGGDGKGRTVCYGWGAGFLSMGQDLKAKTQSRIMFRNGKSMSRHQRGLCPVRLSILLMGIKFTRSANRMSQ